MPIEVKAYKEWLADIGEDEIATLEALADEAGNRGAAQRRYVNADDALEFMNITDGNGFRADNPFRLDWMGEPYQYEARLKNYRPLTDVQYERMLEREGEKRLHGLEDIRQEFPDDFDYMWRY